MIKLKNPLLITFTDSYPFPELLTENLFYGGRWYKGNAVSRDSREKGNFSLYVIADNYRDNILVVPDLKSEILDTYFDAFGYNVSFYGKMICRGILEIYEIEKDISFCDHSKILAFKERHKLLNFL